MFKLVRSLAAAVALAVAFTGTIAPASATLNPVITLVTSSPLAFGASPGVGRIVFGIITFGIADTYVAGGITITPAQVAGQVLIANMVTDAPSPAFETSVTNNVSGTVTFKLAQQMQGASNVTAAGTTKVVTIPTGLTANDVLTINTPIFCQLDNTATGGGGAGTWATTAAVNSCQETSTSSFTLTSTAAAPASNGNFTWFIPTLSTELPAGFPVAGISIPFTAIVL